MLGYIHNEIIHYGNYEQTRTSTSFISSSVKYWILGRYELLQKMHNKAIFSLVTNCTLVWDDTLRFRKNFLEIM